MAAAFALFAIKLGIADEVWFPASDEGKHSAGIALAARQGSY